MSSERILGFGWGTFVGISAHLAFTTGSILAMALAVGGTFACVLFSLLHGERAR